MSQTILAELSHFGLLRFAGQDAVSFLHGQLSCDVKGLPAGQARYGSYNTAKGRMLASFLLWNTGDAILMQLPRDLAEPILKRLKMFVLRAKVESADISANDALLGIAGENAGSILQTQFGNVPDADLSLVKTDKATMLRLAPARYIVSVATADADAVRSALAGVTTPASTQAWDLLDIRAGIPWVLPQTQEAFVPQMANLDRIGGISFNKGCYPGQEIVARMHYLGKLKQRMVRARISATTTPQPGDNIYSAAFGTQASGTIVNAAPILENEYEVLAVLHIEDKDAHWQKPDGAPLVIESLPYA